MSQTSPPPTAGQVLDQTQQTAGQVLDGAQEKVGQVVDQAKQQTTTLLTAQKDQAADTLYTVAHALRQTGQQLRAQEQAPVAGLADRVATRVEGASGYLHRQDVRQLVDDTEGFARRRPVVFVGGALALGILATRFLKSSKRTAVTPVGQTIPAERALVDTTTPADLAINDTVVPADVDVPLPDAAVPVPDDVPPTPAALRVSTDEPLSPVIEQTSTLPRGAS